MKKVYIRTFGCQMNEYDSDKILDVLHSNEPCEKTQNPDEADIILFNTCSVREKAQEKVFSDLGRVRHLKEEKPGLVIGVGGCVASQEGNTILSRAPFVDVVFGPQTIHRLPGLLDKRIAEAKPQIDISFPEIEKFDSMPTPRAEGVVAFVSIMEGCSKYCSFCVVPYTRGEEVSRPLEDVLQEIAELSLQGIKEVTLLGQNVNAYRVTYEGDQVNFAELLKYVAEIPGIERIRYTTSHPKEFDNDLINAYSTLSKLVDHVHLPVQSGSDRILAAMKRGYVIDDYKKTIDALKRTRSTVAIASDFIVGFPGETEDDFQRTLDLVDYVNYDASYSFMYSPRPGTPAATLSDQVPLAIKKERLARLQEKLNTNAKQYSLAMVGNTFDVLVEGPSKKDKNVLSGRASNNRVVYFTGPERLVGQMVSVKITEALTNSLRGNVLINE
jgi:tRNA-2-methylthio-N6-dimethylallyladenosine synthase